MAISVNSVFEVRPNGSDNNGGGFVPGSSGTDYSQQDAPQYALTGCTTSGANTTFSHASAAADMVGNILQVISGANFLSGNFFQVISVVVGVSVTVDRAITSASGSSGVINIGGGFATPGKAAAVPQLVSGHMIWVKAGTYTLTTSTLGAGGPISVASSKRIKMEGYSSVRGDRAGRPSINAGAITSITILTPGGGTNQSFVHLQVDGNSGASVIGFGAAATGQFIDCRAVNCVTGFSFSGNSVISDCGAVNCTTGFSLSSGGAVTRSFAQACGTGFTSTAGAYLFSLCVAADCTGKGFLFAGATVNQVVDGCTAYGCAGDGFDFASQTGAAHWCVATGNGGWGFNNASSAYMEGCASYNNTSGRANSARWDLSPIVLTSDPWVKASTDDFRPNTTPGAGASLRNAGGGVFAQTDNRDVGAVQHSVTLPSRILRLFEGFSVKFVSGKIIVQQNP